MRRPEWEENGKIGRDEKNRLAVKIGKWRVKGRRVGRNGRRMGRFAGEKKRAMQ